MSYPGAVHPDEVRLAISDGGVSKAALAREAKLHENTLRNIESDDWNPRFRTLEVLCKAARKLTR